MLGRITIPRKETRKDDARSEKYSWSGDSTRTTHYSCSHSIPLGVFHECLRKAQKVCQTDVENHIPARL
jgi:hypothetical protein